ncbi:MAG: hypothetical protein RLZZ95_1107, partial [Pseudomonadota bacterium]
MAHIPSHPVDWIVRCPACSSTYRLVPDQLKIAEGWLRCGQCQHTFDSTGLVLVWPHSAEPEPEPEREREREPERVVTPGPEGTDRWVLDDFLKQEDRSVASAPTPEILTSFEQALASFKPQPLPASATPDPSDDADEWRADEQEPSSEPVVHQKGGWVKAGALLLVLALALQWMWIERRTLAAAVPFAGDVWHEACRIAGCEVTAAPVKNGIVIDTSSLTPSEGGGVWLSWTWRNATAHTVQVPDLEVTLLNEQDKAVLRRVISRADMQAPESFTAGQVWSGKLHLVPESGLLSTGYRLL